MKKVSLVLGDCIKEMGELPSESIDLIVSSPPYFNLKSYTQWPSYADYLLDIIKCFEQMVRLLKPGRHICWNIQDNLPEPSKTHRHYYALMPDTIKIAQSWKLEWERNIIWEKHHATQVMFGSYPYPPNMIYSCTTESICIFRKPGKTDLVNKTEASKIDKKEWNVYKNNVWTIKPVTASNHPAPYPKELPSRLIKMHSFVNDVVLDPFGGIFTTGISCKELRRKFIGIEKNKAYFEIGKKRLANTIEPMLLYK